MQLHIYFLPKGYEFGWDGMDCPAICPKNCGSNEMKCWGGRDSWNGCPMEDECFPKDGSK